MRPHTSSRFSPSAVRVLLPGRLPLRFLPLLLASWVCLVAAAPAHGVETKVQRVRHYSAPEYTRIVFDLSRPAAYEVRELRNPDRLVVNIAGGRFAGTQVLGVADGLVDRIRRNQNAARAQAVLDLTSLTRHESFALPAGDGRPARIVIDLFRQAADEARPQVEPPVESSPVAPTLPAAEPRGPAGADPQTSPPVAPVVPPRPFRVILDPGHGGMDPGAIRGKVREKEIVLAVCLELKRLLDAQPGYEAVLTREQDYYPSLSRRVDIARDQKGDLFLSIHCNTHPQPSVSGMEVYFLSLQGATDREAQELADKENAADLVGLAPGDTQGDAVMSILMDLRMTQVLQQSSRLAECVLQATGDAGLRIRRVKQARFQVLRTLAMPAALVELAYLSHAADRALLNSRAGQRQFAAALFAGILRFRDDAADPAVLAAASRGKSPLEDWRKKYKVRRGDSLWDLAQRHGVTMDEIARHNNLRDRSLRIGQNLRLPGE